MKKRKPFGWVKEEPVYYEAEFNQKATDAIKELNRDATKHDWQFAGTAPYQEIGTDRIYFGGTAEIAGYDTVIVSSPSGFVFDPRDRCEYCRTRRQAGQVYCPQCGAPY